jgi:hypothetical protein
LTCWRSESRAGPSRAAVDRSRLGRTFRSGSCRGLVRQRGLNKIAEEAGRRRGLARCEVEGGDDAHSRLESTVCTRVVSVDSSLECASSPPSTSHRASPRRRPASSAILCFRRLIRRLGSRTERAERLGREESGAEEPGKAIYSTRRRGCDRGDRSWECRRNGRHRHDRTRRHDFARCAPESAHRDHLGPRLLCFCARILGRNEQNHVALSGRGDASRCVCTPSCGARSVRDPRRRIKRRKQG